MLTGVQSIATHEAPPAALLDELDDSAAAAGAGAPESEPTAAAGGAAAGAAAAASAEDAAAPAPPDDPATGTVTLAGTSTPGSRPIGHTACVLSDSETGGRAAAQVRRTCSKLRVRLVIRFAMGA